MTLPAAVLGPLVALSEPLIVLAVALLIEIVWGEPPAAIHPVVWMGRTTRGLERRLWRDEPRGALRAGVLVAIAVPAGFAVLGAAACSLLRPLPFAFYPVAGFLLKTTFSIRALDRAAADLRRALMLDPSLARARWQLRGLCSRDPSGLAAPDLVGAAVESSAENTNDSIVAPLFYFVLLGVPGALAYRAVNTSDAMIGYRGRYERFGKAAARLDDLLGWIPARLTAVLLTIAGAVCRQSWRSGLRVGWTHQGRTESPNAGWPMAVMAGLLGVRLEKAGAYALGDARRALEPGCIDEARRLVQVAAGLAALGSAATLWALHG